MKTRYGSQFCCFRIPLDRLCLRKPFDSIRRDKITKKMDKLKIPLKLVRLVRMAMDKAIASVLAVEETIRQIDFKSGVRQGDALSTTLFNIVIDGAIPF